MSLGQCLWLPLFLGQACGLVYRSIFMKHLGLSTNQTGMIWMVERTLATVLPYLIGGFTDKTQKPKAVLLVLLIGGAINLSSMYFIPPEPYVKSDLGRDVSWKGKKCFEGTAIFSLKYHTFYTGISRYP